jgi:hypothetical protein
MELMTPFEVPPFTYPSCVVGAVSEAGMQTSAEVDVPMKPTDHEVLKPEDVVIPAKVMVVPEALYF